MERTALRREARSLLAALDDLEHTGHALTCQVCGGQMRTARRDQRYCSNACKQRAWRMGYAKPTPSKRRAWIAE